MSKHIVDDLRVLEGLTVPKTAGKGILTDTDSPSYTWRDLTGRIRPDPAGTDAPALSNFIGGVRVHSFGDSPSPKKMDMEFHIDHDWVPNSDAFIHIHWGHNGTGISGSLVANYKMTYGDRDGVYFAQVEAIQTVADLNITNSPQYVHRVDEIPLMVETPVAGQQIDRSLIHVDGLLLVTLEVTTIPTITGGAPNHPFVFTVDIHYQSTNVGTKNSAHPFYGE